MSLPLESLAAPSTLYTWTVIPVCWCFLSLLPNWKLPESRLEPDTCWIAARTLEPSWVELMFGRLHCLPQKTRVLCQAMKLGGHLGTWCPIWIHVHLFFISFCFQNWCKVAHTQTVKLGTENFKIPHGSSKVPTCSPSSLTEQALLRGTCARVPSRWVAAGEGSFSLFLSRCILPLPWQAMTMFENA